MFTITIHAWWKIRNCRENVHLDCPPKVKKTKENGEEVNDAQKWISWRLSWLTNDDRRRRHRFLGVRRRTSDYSLQEEGRKQKGRIVWHSPRGKYRSANWNSVQQPSLIYVWNRSLRTLWSPPSPFPLYPTSSRRAFRVHQRICALFIRRDCEWWATSIPLPPHPSTSWKFHWEVGKSRTRLPS